MTNVRKPAQLRKLVVAGVVALVGAVLYLKDPAAGLALLKLALGGL